MDNSPEYTTSETESSHSKESNEVASTSTYMPDIAKCSTTLPNTTSKQVRSRKKPGIRRVKKEAREEAKWLDAIESGNLEGISKEFTKITDPLRMTDRQRDIYFRDTCNQPTAPLLSIPTIYRAKKTVSPQKRALINEKKRDCNAKKLEDKKRQIVSKIFRPTKMTQEAQAIQSQSKQPTQSAQSSIVYKQNIYNTTITFPEGVEYPLKAMRIPLPPPKRYCVMGCGNLKKYTCSNTEAYVCSLDCYKRNLTKNDS